MEIILALMALAATPFGAAMLDKPTRGRFVKFAKAHNPRKRQTVAEFLAIEPRNKDWSSDRALMTLWEECFKFYSLANAERRFDEIVGRFREEERKVIEAKANLDRANAKYDATSHFSEPLWEARFQARMAYDEVRRYSSAKFVGADKDLIDLAKKYNANNAMELRYKQDLIRLTNTENFTYGLDFLAIAK